eukprot:gb/GFBE01056570.1/.p1 GENE.gb/GFBE01056570.1/~~gb/GFBE01056570.1/.p1  ORF type:complete len:660 (+),score=114.11 gb/GFBE01056570.1/:1-1980(+)
MCASHCVSGLSKLLSCLRPPRCESEDDPKTHLSSHDPISTFASALDINRFDFVNDDLHAKMEERLSDSTEEAPLTPDMMSEISSIASGDERFLIDTQRQPRSIFHALHLTFDSLRLQLPELAWKGFDAVQIPPAQLSPKGDLRNRWWYRYQPLNYSVIDPTLGGEFGLRKLCEEAAELGIVVIADCVFNHMAIVATKDEWRDAQHDHELLESLKTRLDNAFGPELNREDFQWPWICLEGGKWDDPKFMYEGWGCGEWSELAFSKKVVRLHKEHLRILLACGVRGFRIDAAKHMRPSHVTHYVDYLHKLGAFVYTEVLSLDQRVHAGYEALGVPSTDYLLAAEFCRAWRSRGGGGAIFARLEAMQRLGPDSIQFVRSHDTMLNEGPAICGIDWGAEEASLAWGYLIARSEGSILIHQDDANSPLIHSALAFRSALNDASDGASLETSLVAWPPGRYDMVLLLLTLQNRPVGLAVFNFSYDMVWELPVPVTMPWDLASYQLREVITMESVGRMGVQVSSKMSEVLIPTRGGKFFLVEKGAKTSGSSVAPTFECLTIYYHTGWHTPHIHFGMKGCWTEAPGWPLRRSGKPPSGMAPKGHGSWWRIDVPTMKGFESIEFVLNDGRNDWDNTASGGNYVAEGMGAYSLVHGTLQKCSNPTCNCV